MIPPTEAPSWQQAIFQVLKKGGVGRSPTCRMPAMINARGATGFAQVLIRADEPPRALPPRDGPYVKNRFRAALGLRPF